MAKAVKKSKKVKSLAAKGLTSKQAKGVKGGADFFPLSRHSSRTNSPTAASGPATSTSKRSEGRSGAAACPRPRNVRAHHSLRVPPSREPGSRRWPTAVPRR